MPGCKFKDTWTEIYLWASRVKGDNTRVLCTICHKGVHNLERHQKGDKHVDNVKKKAFATNPVTGARLKVNTIQEALKKSEARAVEERKTKDDALRAEAALSRLIATHNLPLRTIDCLAVLLPQIFHDSEIAKQMSLHKTKALYTLEFGLAEHELKKIIKQLHKFPFSINFDESVKGKTSQLTIMVSFRNDENRIQKSHFATIKINVRLTGENISNAVFGVLEEKSIKCEEKLVSDTTDGCPVMLGKYSGCHAISKKKVPQLPDLGGCGCHDACNCLKHGVSVLNPDLVSLWKATYPCLEKASIKKSLHYQDICHELGLVFKHTPKYLDVRFRYSILLAKFFEDNNRALYTYFWEIARSYQVTGQVRVEILILMMLLSLRPNFHENSNFAVNLISESNFTAVLHYLKIPLP